MSLILGVDGGGTSTRAVCIDETGGVLGHAKVGSTNRNHHTRAEVIHHLTLALEGAAGRRMDEVTDLFLGMAGVSTEADRAEIISMTRQVPGLPRNVNITVENDTLSGLVGGLAGAPGIVLIAGTGSAAWGRNASGQTALCGGWGALADDRGSAYALSLDAIHCAVRAEDGRSPETALQDVVFRFFGVQDNPRALLDRLHNSKMDRAEIAQLAPHVLHAYATGDEAAGELVQTAISALCLLVATVANQLFPPDTPFGIVFVGGLALSGDPFQPKLSDAIHARCPGAQIVAPILPPEFGAALEALRRRGLDISPDLIARLQAGVPR